jgi:cation diffusion facilitator CzcD-associated flavoprotein CzcO
LIVIVVIGGGSAGLAAAAALQRAGERVVVLERSAVGSVWSSRYDRLHLHTVRWLSSLPGSKMPRSYGKWPSRDAVANYLRDYAKRQQLDVRCGVEVTGLKATENGWSVKTSAEELPATRVVVATGLSNMPFLPHWTGELGGTIVHSADYRNGERYRGKRVLVAGAGNSGAEIAVDLVEHGAASVLLSVRTPPAIVRRDTMGIPSQLLGIASAHLPTPVVDAIAASIRRIAIPNLEPYGLPAPAKPYSTFLRKRTLPILDVGIVAAVRAGTIRVVSALERFEPGFAILADGSREQIDSVVAATGYRSGLERLVGDLGVLDDKGDPLVTGAEEHPNAPGLHFVGYRVVLGGSFREAGIEARQLATSMRQRLNAGRSRSPSVRGSRLRGRSRCSGWRRS